jgi:hypothetical protein
MIRSLAMFSILAMIFACNNSSPEQKTAKEDSVMNEVMKGHNAAMAKTERISQAQSRIQLAIDSITRLPPKVQSDLASYKLGLDSTLSRLKYAEYAMDKWMEDFNMDSLKDDLQKRIAYLESEKTKVLRVRDVMVKALQQADSILKEKK